MTYQPTMHRNLAELTILAFFCLQRPCFVCWIIKTGRQNLLASYERTCSTKLQEPAILSKLEPSIQCFNCPENDRLSNNATCRLSLSVSRATSFQLKSAALVSLNASARNTIGTLSTQSSSVSLGVRGVGTFFKSAQVYCTDAHPAGLCHRHGWLLICTSEPHSPSGSSEPTSALSGGVPSSDCTTYLKPPGGLSTFFEAP